MDLEVTVGWWWRGRKERNHSHLSSSPGGHFLAAMPQPETQFLNLKNGDNCLVLSTLHEFREDQSRYWIGKGMVKANHSADWRDFGNFTCAIPEFSFMSH